MAQDEVRMEEALGLVRIAQVLVGKRYELGAIRVHKALVDLEVETDVWNGQSGVISSSCVVWQIPVDSQSAVIVQVRSYHRGSTSKGDGVQQNRVTWNSIAIGIPGHHSQVSGLPSSDDVVAVV